MKAFWLGRRPYEPLHELQRQLGDARVEGTLGDTVLLLEHDPVITLGRAADPAHVLHAEAALRARGVELAQTGRGGDVTYHGPGQLVAYPILDLKPDRCDVRVYVRSLAEVMIQLARDLGVEAGTVDGLIGVWADRQKPEEWASEAWARELVKLGAIGVRLSRWITMHGFAFNVSVDLRAFDLIVPCGIRDHGVTSIADLVGQAPSVEEVALGARRALERALDAEVDGIADLSRVPTTDLREQLLGAWSRP